MNADWETLYDEHAAALSLYARQWLPCAADAEDAVQDAFVRLLKSPKAFGHRPVPVLYQAVKWAALDRARRAGRRGKREEQSVAPGDEEVMFEDPVERRERRELVEEALRALPGEQREVLVLHIWGELGFREIGVTLGISPNTAASRYRYALKKLGEAISRTELIA